MKGTLKLVEAENALSPLVSGRKSVTIIFVESCFNMLFVILN